MKATVRQAMLLAAGRGERLRPLTDQCPKPLLKVKGAPLLVHHLDKLEQAGFQQVVINLGWLGEQIPIALSAYLNNQSFRALRVIYSPEPPGALETAGGIRHALSHFNTEPFVLVSADVLTDIDYTRLMQWNHKSKAQLMLVNNPPHHPEGDFMLNGPWVVSKEPSDLTQPTLTYSGLGTFCPSLFESLSPGHRPLRPVLEDAIKRREVLGHHHHGHWMDVGSVERFEQAQQLPWINSFSSP